MELTDLRARSRELREVNKKQKANTAIGERLAGERIRKVEDQCRKEQEARSSCEEENRVLKQRLSTIQRNQGSIVCLDRCQSPEANTQLVAPSAEELQASALVVSAVPDPPLQPSLQPPVQLTPPRTSTTRDVALGATAAAGAAAAGGAVTAAGSTSTVAAYIETIGTRPGPRKQLAEVPKLSLSGIPEGVNTLPSPSIALQQLADTTATPASRECCVQIIEEHVAALRRELEDLHVVQNVQAPTLGHSWQRSGSFSTRSLRRTSTCAAVATSAAPRGTPAVPEITTRASTVAAARDALNSARETLNSARENARMHSARSLLSMSLTGRMPGGQVLSPRLDESMNSTRDCINSARDSVHSLMTQDALSSKLDKMNASIHSMLVAATTTVEEVHPPMPKHEEEGEWPLSPASGTSSVGLTISTSAGFLESTGVATQLALMRELSCMSELLRAQEVGGPENLARETPRHSLSVELQQQLLATESENNGLREKLHEAEKHQAKLQMEMQAMKRSLQTVKSAEVLGTTTATTEVPGWQCHSTSTIKRVHHSSAVLRPCSLQAPSYCYPSAQPTCYRTWQKHRSPRWGGSGLHRSISTPRVIQYPQPSARASSLTSQAEDNVSQHQGALHSIAIPMKGLPNSMPTRSMAKRTRISASSGVITAAAPIDHMVVGGHTRRARSSSPACSVGAREHGVSITNTSACAWSARSVWNARSAPTSRQCSRSPSPVASVAAPVGLCRAEGSIAAPVSSRSPSPQSTGHSSMVAGHRVEPHLLVKLRDSPPRRVSPRGSLVQRSHWRLVRKGSAQES